MTHAASTSCGLCLYVCMRVSTVAPPLTCTADTCGVHNTQRICIIIYNAYTPKPSLTLHLNPPQVYILSRMGSSRAALALIIEKLSDVPRAIEFVRQQRDDELVDELIDWALASADTTGVLMCVCVCAHVCSCVCKCSSSS